MAIIKPIFIIGSGRSGTTIFYNFFSIHPEVCWFSNYSSNLLRIKPMPVFHRVFDMPFVGTQVKKGFSLKRKIYIKPSEAGHIYHNYCGFQHAVKTTEEDLDKAQEKKFKEIIENHLLLTGKKRFLSKQTANTQRIRLINRMFEDAYYIHILRDGRAVASSLLNVRFWNDTDIWWLGEKASEWEKKGKPAIELCGLHWKRDVEEILENKSLFEDRYIEIKYENFVEDVWGTLDKVADFCELGQSDLFSKMLPKTLPNMNYKWNENLTDQQKDILNKELAPFLSQLGYD